MTDDPFAHLAAGDTPCTRHPRASQDALLLLAAIGSRMASYNHDLASKIQGLMMAIDELEELIGARGDRELGATVETARAALGELGKLLATNRALTRPALGAAPLRELVARAGERVGVAVTGELPDRTLAVTVPLVTQALALVFDVAAGPGRSRSLAVAAGDEGSHVTLALRCAAGAANTGEALALASFILARDEGGLRCTDEDGLVLRLAVAAAPAS